MTMIPHAVRPLTEEEKAKHHPYRVGALITFPAAVLPQWKATYDKSWIFNQAETDPNNDECGGASLAMVLSIREGRPIDPHYHWMMARERAGEKISDFGVGNDDLAMTSVKVGSLLREDSPFSFQTPRDTIADVTKWDLKTLRPKAWEQISGSVVWVKQENGMDAFDTFRASVTKFNQLYGKEHGAVFGMEWNYDIHAYTLDTLVESGSGHDIAIIGWDMDYAIAVQSYGLEAGDQGEVKIHRSIINNWAEKFGMFIPIDATQDQIKVLVDSGGKLDNYWLTNILVAFASALKDLLAKLSGHA